MTPVVLITVSPRASATGVPTTLRLAGGGNLKPYLYGGQSFRAGIADLPRFKAQLAFDESGWTGATMPTTSTIAWAPGRKADLAELAAYFWPGAAITIEEGYEEVGVFTTRLTGKVADAAVQDQRLAITVKDLSDDLDRPILTARFLGTGGVEGSAEAKGRIKRRAWGRPFNIEGRVLDPANNILEFGDLSFPWQSFELLRDVGRAEAPPHSTIAWQGSIAATLEALRTSSPAVGTGVAAPSICCVKWWTRPRLLTADVKGEVGTGYVETAPSIAERILIALAGPAVTNVAAANVLRGDIAGIAVDENETIAAALDRLLLPVSLGWVLNPAGAVTMREITFVGPVETLNADNVDRERTLAPIKSRRVGYQRANRVHSESELATILLEAGASFVQATPPAALDSAPGAHWQDSDDNFRLYVRVAGSGFLQLAGGALILNGAPVELAWTAAGAGPDNTAANQIVVVAPPDQHVAATYMGVIITGQLSPRILVVSVNRGGVDIRTSNDCSYSITTSSGVGATIDNTAGSADKGKISWSTMTAITGWIDLGVAVVGVAQPTQRILVFRDDADPPSGGGSSSVTIDSFAAISGASYVSIGGPVTLVMGAGGSTTLAVALGYSGSGAGSATPTFKLQQRTTSGPGAWTDVTGGAQAGGAVTVLDGDVSFSRTHAGTPATSYDYQLVALRSGTATINPFGTVAVSTS